MSVWLGLSMIRYHHIRCDVIHSIIALNESFGISLCWTIDVYRRQILTYKDGPRAEGVTIGIHYISWNSHKLLAVSTAAAAIQYSIRFAHHLQHAAKLIWSSNTLYMLLGQNEVESPCDTVKIPICAGCPEFWKLHPNPHLSQTAQYAKCVRLYSEILCISQIICSYF